MATYTPQDSRSRPVKNRVQVLNPITGRWVKLDTRTGRIVGHKRSPGPYKGVRRKEPGRPLPCPADARP